MLLLQVFADVCWDLQVPNLNYNHEGGRDIERAEPGRIGWGLACEEELRRDDLADGISNEYHHRAGSFLGEAADLDPN